MLAIPRVEGTVIAAVIVWVVFFFFCFADYVDREKVLVIILVSAPGVVVIWIVGTILFLLFGYKRRNPFWIDLLAGLMDYVLVIIFGMFASGAAFFWFGKAGPIVVWMITPLFWRLLALSLWKISNKFERPI